MDEEFIRKNRKRFCDKTGYSKNQVHKVRQAAYRARNRKLRIYECMDCGKWHLSSSFWGEI